MSIPAIRIMAKPHPKHAWLAILAIALIVPAAHALPLVGFQEHWPGTSLQTWGGGAELLNPGTGGTGGVGDGFLLVSTPFPAHLGAVSFGPEYTGDWIAGGVNKVHVWLNDVNTPEALEIHFSIGNRFNFWEYNVGFVPPHGAWKEFVVDLSDATQFTRIIGQGTFQAALQAVDRIHLRHDKAPFTQSPDYIQGDFGIDRLLLTNDAVPVRADSWGRVKRLYR